MAQRIGSILAVGLLGRASMSPMNPEGQVPRLIGQDPRNSRREQAVTRQDRGRRRVDPGPAGDSCWSPPLWQSHWARARLHDGRDRHVRIHPTHPDHWAGPPGWDRLCHPKVTALIPFRVSAAPPGRPAPRADERGRPGWARPRHRRELEVNDRVSLCRYAGVVPVGSVRFRLAHRVSCCYRKRADLPIQDHPARPPGQIC